MQAASDMGAAAVQALNSKASSLRQFGRFGAVIIGVVSGSVAVATQQGKREAAYKAALGAKDAEIAELKLANNAMKMEKEGTSSKPSSGDPVQDWIDSLAE